MPEMVPFAAYVRDKSNAVGFQFEFICGRCGNGYASSFQAASSLSADAGGAAIKKLGGLLGAVGDFVGDHAADMMKDKVKDAALERATREVAPYFAQCPRCRRWVCRTVCLNAAQGVCVDCANQIAAAPISAGGYPSSAPAPYPPPSAPFVAPQSSGVPVNPGYPAPATGTPPYPAPPAYPIPPGYAPPSAPYAVPPQYPPSAYMPPPVGAYPSGMPFAPMPMMPPRTSNAAITSFVFAMLEVTTFLGLFALPAIGRGVFGLFLFLWALLAIIFGHVGHGEIKRGQGRVTGGGLATTGLVLGYVALAPLALVVLIFIVAGIIFFATRH